MRTTGVLLVLLSLGPVALAQLPPSTPPKDLPPTKSTLRDTEHAIVVEGCIRGNRLKIQEGGSLTVRLLDVSEFVLEGPKELMKRLETDHDGHQDEISGVVIVPASQEEPPVVQTKEIGKRTRIVAGTSGAGRKESSGQMFKPLRLKFGSVKHLAEKCSIPGA